MFINCHSWFSFTHGVMKPDALLEEAARMGVRSFALTDIHCSAGIPDLVRDAPRYGVRPVAGIEFRQGPKLLYIGLARNNDGFQRLNELLSPHLLDDEALPERPPELEDVFFIHPFAHAPHQLRPNERVGIRPSDLTRLPFSPWRNRMNDLVALMPVTFRAKKDHTIHRLLRTVAKNTVVSMLPKEELADAGELFHSEEEVRSIYRDFPQLVGNAQRLLEDCSIAVDGSDKTRAAFTGSARADREKLHRDTREGLRYRYPEVTPKILARMHHELDVIERMGFISYFLINQDIVDHARGRGFFHVGRGSGANSLVAYCLRITDVDPMELDLYFERFINPARKKPPDFDIDFSWKDRDEVYRYVFGKYNTPDGRAGGIHAAQIATYTTFQWRGAIRELGKAVGLPPAEIDALSEGDHGYYARGRPSAYSKSGDLDKVARAVVRYAKELIGMPHHLGIHAGGIVITEKPVTHFAALFRPPKGFPVTQISMLECEDLGLHKFDLLSQRGLGHIRDAVELVNANTGGEWELANGEWGMQSTPPFTNSHSPFTSSPHIDIHDIARFKQDPAIKELLRKGDTIGCFYVESPAMRMLLKKLKVDDYLGLVAASSIIRPGVAESGMMREYLLRHNDPERVKQAPKRLLEIMPETYGVMVYQEDVIKVVHLYGGLDLEESDQVRRGMNIRYRDRPEFKLVERKFFDNCRAFGYPPGEAEEVWRQIQSFASFSFAKGHSASYAVESYQSLYLKAHHPLEFLVGVANNFGGFYRTEFYLHEAKRAGAVIEAPCVNTSEELCSLHSMASSEWRVASKMHPRHSPLTARHSPLSPLSPLIYLGLANIKSLENGTVQLILNERRRNGPFTDLQDLLKRVPLAVEQARILIRAGALRFTGKSKPHLLWDLTLLHQPARVTADGDLFVTRVEEPRLPDLQHYPLADAYDELDLLGFPLCDPFTLVQVECLRTEPTHDSADAQSHPRTVPAHQQARDSAHAQAPGAAPLSTERDGPSEGTVARETRAVALSTEREGPSEGTVACEPGAAALSTEREGSSEGTVARRTRAVALSTEREGPSEGTVAQAPGAAPLSTEREGPSEGTVVRETRAAPLSTEREGPSEGTVAQAPGAAPLSTEREGSSEGTVARGTRAVALSTEREGPSEGTVARGTRAVALSTEREGPSEGTVARGTRAVALSTEREGPSEGTVARGPGGGTVPGEGRARHCCARTRAVALSTEREGPSEGTVARRTRAVALSTEREGPSGALLPSALRGAAPLSTERDGPSEGTVARGTRAAALSTERDGPSEGTVARGTRAVALSTVREGQREGTIRIPAREMSSCVGRTVEMLGYMIHVKATTTQTGNYMSFGCFIDPAGDFWDSTQFPQVAARYPFGGRGVYRLTGVVEEEFGHCALRTISMEKLPWRPDPRYGTK
ncbi:MAG: DNA polymerase III subunit alpha [Flavobacteriales bacterium]|nr:DNA polymerase III subunit alpha [Flavobacteriales bacterium]